jgi:hypothetical protein
MIFNVHCEHLKTCLYTTVGYIEVWADHQRVAKCFNVIRNHTMMSENKTSLAYTSASLQLYKLCYMR